MGACSSTTERDADYLMENNFHYSCAIASWAVSKKIPFLYASSAATYGDGSLGFSDDDRTTPKLLPINMYGYSKQLFDLWVMRNNLLGKVAGIKFFNVFGPNEYHKGEMRSVVHKSFGQILQTGKVQHFKSHRKGFGHGEQIRDFVYVKDCVEIKWWMLKNPKAKGIFNLGTGKARTWNDLVKAVFKASDAEVAPAWAARNGIEFTNLEEFARLPEVIDDTLVALQVTGEDGSTLGTVVNWSSHPEALGGKNTLATSDFPHYLRARLEGRLGGTSVFLVGSIGGLMTPLGLKLVGADGKEVPADSFALAQAVGERAPHAALAALAGGRPSASSALEHRSTTVFVPLENRLFRLATFLGVLDREVYSDGRPATAIFGDDLRTEIGYLRLGDAEALQAGLDPKPFAIAIAVAASASFSTPIGYQTNMMVYGPGGYRFLDFLRVGIPLNLLFMAVSLAVIPLFWSF